MKLRATTLLAAMGLAIASTWSGNASAEHFAYSGAACHPIGDPNDANVELWSQGEIANMDSTSSQGFTCDLVNEYGSNGYINVDVRVYDSHYTEPVLCQFASFNFDRTSGGWSSAHGSWGNNRFQTLLGQTTHYLYAYGPSLVYCTLPPAAAGESWISSLSTDS